MTASTQPSMDEVLAHEEPQFARAAKAVLVGNPQDLRQVLSESPELVHSKSRSKHGATLLHYVTSNAIEDELQLSPQQIYNAIQSVGGEQRQSAQARALEVAQVLIEAGCEVDALADGYGGGPAQTPLNWLVSSGHPAAAGVQAELTKIFCRGGAQLDGLLKDSSPVFTALGFGHPQAAKVLFEEGCLVDNILLAAAAGDVEKLKELRNEDGFSVENIRRCENPWFKPPQTPDHAAQLALVFASMCGQISCMQYLVDSGVDLDATPVGTFMTGGALHTAALICQEQSVDFLIGLGADPTQVESRYGGDAFGWARQGNCPRIMEKVGQYYCHYRRQREGSEPKLQAFIKAVFAEDMAALEQVLSSEDWTPAQLDGPWFHFDAPAVVQVKSRLDLVDRLVQAGANINQKSYWWAGGFGVLDETEPELAEQLMERGARLDVWSAAALSKLNPLKEMIEAEPKLVSARGPDGKTPLHCAGSVGVAVFLLSKAADVNARCYDHESTPVQYLIAEHPEIVRYLVGQGAEADIMLAAALGDVELAERILAEDPEAIHWQVSREYFPSAAADCIYSWTLGWYLTPHQVARKFKNEKMVAYLLEHSDAATQLLNACLLNERELVAELATEMQPAQDLSESQRRHLAHAARNNALREVTNLLEAGFPANVRGQHQATPLHWAAFHGNCKMVEVILAHDPDLELRDADFGSTPFGWACHGANHGWYRESGDYLATLQALLRAGCQIPQPWQPIGHEQIDAWMERH